jgi:hypothetical protein
MPEVYGGTLEKVVHCARTAPAVIQGSFGRSGSGRATLVVPKGTGLVGAVVKLHNPINDNINMNQVLSDVRTGTFHAIPSP